MDAQHFDDLVRRLATGTSRRALVKGVLAGLVGGMAGLTGTRSTGAAATQPNGSPCTRSTDCASRICKDGVCCNSACTGQCEACNLPGLAGTCSPVTGNPVGGRPACPGTGPCQGTCTGSNRQSCALPGPTVSCGVPTCAGGFQTTYGCGGNGTCHPTTTSCGLYLCKSDGTGCLTSCTSSAQCVGAAFCANGVCQGDKPLGQACSSNNQCQSGFCVDSVCCNSACSGACQACNVPGNVGFCAEEADGASCQGGTCCDGDCVDTQTDPEHCGRCDNACRLVPQAGSCEASPICQTGQCTFTPAPQGAECRPAAGVCDIAEVCDGASLACPADQVRPNTVVCRPAAGPCDVAETCTGTSAACPSDGFQPSTVQCRAGSCANGVATLPANCPGNGPNCPVGQTQNCGPYVCGPTACRTTCTDDMHCIASHHCDDGQCLPDEGLGAACDEDGDCQSGFCVNGICCNERCPGECVQCTAATNGICTPATNETACGPMSGQVCCAGTCCAAGASCDGATCQAACLELQTACDPANDRCCDDEGTVCGGTTCTPGTPRCCRPVGAACSGTCDCCDGATCVSGQCRAFCTAGGESCSDDDECCSGACSMPPDCAFGIDFRCCHGAGEDCSFACECCAGLACSPEEVCCAPAGASCESFIECCGNACENGRCCASNGRACAETADCCEGEGLVCRNGLCRPEACLPLQEVCIFDDDCCGESASTFCRVACDSLRTCCSTTPGPCAENCDCCGDDNCVGGQCCRAAGGDACAADDECCGELVCRGFPDSSCCHPTGAACGPVLGGGDTCCAGNHCVERGPLGIGVCETCFGDFHERCDSDDQCCSGYCHQAHRWCCRTEGASCSQLGAFGFECCPYLGLTCSLESGSCIPCRTAGESCEGAGSGGFDSTCCLGLNCENGRCVEDVCGGACQVDSTCCEGQLCDANNGVCVLVCAAEGMSCALGVGCCEGLFCDPPNITGHCRRP